MQKRKMKINILDFAIFVAIACSVAALLFHDVINDFFQQPEITSIEMTLVTDTLPDDSASILIAGKSAILKAKDGNGTDLEISLKSVKTDSKGNTTFTMSCSGYKKLGRCYAENGEKFNVNGKYILNFGSVSLECVLNSADVRIR